MSEEQRDYFVGIEKRISGKQVLDYIKFDDLTYDTFV